MACVDDADDDDDDDDDDNEDDEDDVKEVDAKNDNNIGSTNQYEVQRPFWDEIYFFSWRVFPWLVLN